jgi:D-serine deaminase-like pyridoxal phosphate-dependent protein
MRRAQVFDEAILARELERLRHSRVDPCSRGFLTAPGSTPADLVGRSVLDGFVTPVAIVKASALASNAELMARYARSRGVSLAPHVKTTMSPQLFGVQLRSGAWGLTVAHMQQLAVCRRFGVRRIMLANEVVDPAAARWLAAAMAGDERFEPHVWVDSLEGVHILDRAMQTPGGERRLSVLIEVGMANGRSGVRTVSEAVELGRAIRKTRTLSLEGVAGFEGVVGGDESVALQRARAFCNTLRDTVATLGEYGLVARDQPIVTAGGSAYFDIVAEKLHGCGEVVLRAGSYIVHDHGHVERFSPYHRGAGPAFGAALEIWAHVVSCPEPQLAIACAGKRDLSHDLELPVVLRAKSSTRWRRTTGLTVTKLNDQHAYIATKRARELTVGDLVALGISHPCTALDKWRYLPIVDDGYRIVDVATTHF